MNIVMYISIPDIFHGTQVIQTWSFGIRSLQNNDPGITFSLIFSVYFSAQKSIPGTPLASRITNLFHQDNVVFPVEELPHVATTTSKKDLECILHIQSEMTTTTKFYKCLSN